MATDRKAAVGFIFITLLIDVMGWGLIIPVMPELIAQLKNIPVNEASPYGAWLLSAYAFTQFVFAPVIGNLSDKYGRRPVLLGSLLGFGIDYLFLALAPTYGWLFVGRIIAGITGASFTTATAYIADISTEETQSKEFWNDRRCFRTWFYYWPGIRRFIGWPWDQGSFLCSCRSLFIECIVWLFCFTESLSKENRRNFHWKRANPIGSLKLLKRYPAIGGLAIAFFLIYLAAQAVQGNWSFFTIYRFNWSEKMVGISLAVVGVLVGGCSGRSYKSDQSKTRK